MAVYIYSDRAKTICIGVCEDDGRVFDKRDSMLDSSPRLPLGRIGDDSRVYSDMNRLSCVGLVDSSGRIYRGWSDTTAPIGYVYNGVLYRDVPAFGEVATGPELAYFDGYGDVNTVAAATLLLLLGRSSASGEYDEWTPGVEENRTPSGIGGDSSSMSCSGMLAVFVVIGLVVYFIFNSLFGDALRERSEKYEADNAQRQEEIYKGVLSTGYVELSDTHGQYTGYFGEIATKSNFILNFEPDEDVEFTVEVKNIDPSLEIEAVVMHMNAPVDENNPKGEVIEYAPGDKISAVAGDEFKIKVWHRGGTGYYTIDIFKE